VTRILDNLDCSKWRNETNQYPRSQETLRVVVGQYDPGEQKISLLFSTPVQISALPQS